MMSGKTVKNLHLLPSFSRPEFDPDGIHLTPFSGLELVYHLFDSSKVLLKSLKNKPEARQAVSCEAIRSLQDRMMATEQDHKRLNASFESRMAVDAELADFQENVRNEVFFVVSGLPRVSQELRGRDWQQQALLDVKKFILALLGKELPVVVVQNITGRGADHVRMQFASDSQEIRSKFGSYFMGGADRRPDLFRNISISNRITPGTQTRIAVLRLLAKRYEASNPLGKAKVIGFESRPVIRLTPPPDASDRRVRTMHYIEAIRILPTCFTPAEVRPILSKVDPKFRGKLRSTFVVLSDDDFQPRQPPSRIPKRGRESDLVDEPEPKRA